MKTAADPSLQAPKRWWNSMEKRIKKSNPDYSAETVAKTIGKIWSDLPDSKKSEIRGREGKSYGPAKKESNVKSDVEAFAEFIEDFILGYLPDAKIDSYDREGHKYVSVEKGVRKVVFTVYTNRASQDIFGIYFYDDEIDPNLEGGKLDHDHIGMSVHLDSPDDYTDYMMQAVNFLKGKEMNTKKESKVNKITAATLKDLFTSDYKKWIQMEVQILAMNSGTYANEEQANTLLTAACDKLIKIIQDGVDEEVKRVVKEVREDTIESMMEDVQAPEQAPVPVATPSQEQIAAPQAAPVPVPVASKKIGEKSEQEIAENLKEKGYNYIIIFSDADIKPLYTKTVEQASKLIREEYKDEHVDIKKIDDFLEKKAQESQSAKQEIVKFMDFVEDFVNDSVPNVKIKHGPGEYGVTTWFYANDGSKRVEVHVSGENLFSVSPYFNKNGEWVRPRHGVDLVRLSKEEIIHPEDYTDYFMQIVNFLKRIAKNAQLENTPPGLQKLQEEGPVSITYEKFGPGKFDDNVQAFVYDKILEGSGDETIGDEAFGIYDLVTFDPPVTVKQDKDEWFFGGAITYVSDQGFVYVDYFDTIDEAKKDFERISKEYDKFVEENPTED